MLACKEGKEHQSTNLSPHHNNSEVELMQMNDSIDAIIARTNFRSHPYESTQKLMYIENEINESRLNKSLNIKDYIEYGTTLLEAGKSTKAISIFEDILSRFPENNTINKTTKTFHEILAISYMRQGEQTNCIENHSKESCLFPIKGDGVHLHKGSSQNAISIYEKILEVFPDDLRSRWLLNLAYMTTGEYPYKPDQQYLIPGMDSIKNHGIGYFENIAMDLSLDYNDIAGGAIMDDFNNDGFIDIVTSSWSMSGKMKYFINDGTGGFIDATETSGLESMYGGLNLVQADYNNDGYLDFLIIRGAWRGLKWMGQLPNSLIKNNGDGTFSDVTISSGIYHESPTQSATWLDFNCDGWLDLYIGNETHSEKEPHPCELLLNNKDGTFTNVAPRMGINIKSYVKGVTSGDINNDGLPDIYISSINNPNILLVNRGGTKVENWIFEDISRGARVEEPIESFPTWFFDFNNDGWEDIFVSSFDRYSLYQQSREVAADFLGLPSNSDYPRLYQNEGDEKFLDVTEQTGLNHILATMGCNYGDLNNDGFQDFYLGTGAPDYRAIVPNRMFKNQNGNKFLDVTFEGNFGHIQKGHGISFADIDNDGDQDIYAVLGGSYTGDNFQNALFENPGHGNAWITIRLTGTKSNRSAIGARIKIMTETHDDQIKEIYNTVSSGGSFGANSLQAEIGLGNTKKIINVSVNWPNGNSEYIDYGSLPINQTAEIIEGNNNAKTYTSKSIKFKMSGNSHHHNH